MAPSRIHTCIITSRCGIGTTTTRICITATVTDSRRPAFPGKMPKLNSPCEVGEWPNLTPSRPPRLRKPVIPTEQTGRSEVPYSS